MSDFNCFFVGVDVGTSSVRAAVVDNKGEIKSSASAEIKIWEPRPGLYEQSSENIWACCCEVVKKVTNNIDKKCIKGIGFDATCSLVALDANFQPISVSPSGSNEQNVVMWMDHRAHAQAQRINATHHDVLKYVGGSMSLEMEPPKLLWLKENLPETWAKAGNFFDLPDYMTYKATGSTTRSLCSLVCKWAYQADSDGKNQWDESFMKQIGLEELLLNDFAKIGNVVLSPGEPVGNGLSTSAANDLGLHPGIPVGCSIIDAHAGGIGMLGLTEQQENITNKLAIISGTSSCHMAVSEAALFVPGVWGPYYSAMIPGYWLNEGGQSASGKLIDFVIETHRAYDELKMKSAKRNIHVHDFMNELLLSVAINQKLQSPASLTADLHVWPDFHGNRSPLADPNLKGMISGLALSSSIESLALLYLATIQAIALGTKHIIESMEKAGHSFSSVFSCGGLSKNKLFVQVHADVTGAAILGACASSQFEDVQDAMKHMCKVGSVVEPIRSNMSFYKKKYAVFKKMVQDQKEYQSIMESISI
ncbi:FGGY carbohydrate kinase domain-containing protein-like isoform X2 [Antedon mediterranea]|uniref:FGGY carbohydrate kinase domain-containing protein-like isoform X2 n=1 Tax=Antedon mediterranea TaxID=105859 RepID=UPI003AF752EF